MDRSGPVAQTARMGNDNTGVAARRSGKTLAAAGIVIGAVGVVMVLWAAAPLLGPLPGLMSSAVHHLGPLPSISIPAWLVKLLVAAVLLSLGAMLTAVGGARWGLGALRGRRARALAQPSPRRVPVPDRY